MKVVEGRRFIEGTSSAPGVKLLIAKEAVQTMTQRSCFEIPRRIGLRKGGREGLFREHA